MRFGAPEMRRQTIVVAVFLTLASARAAAPVEADPPKLPYGLFPSLRSVTETPRETEDLQTEIRDLQRRVESTVRSFATRRNVTCFDAPCLIQAFPMMYNSPATGFWGGLRANVANMTRTDPYAFSVDSMLLRSDTNQWITYLAFDAPNIEWLPTQPRIKVRMNRQRTTETRYYGTGTASKLAVDLPDDQVRYALQETGFQTSILVPLASFSDRRLFGFASFAVIDHHPSKLSSEIPSLLFVNHPTGTKHGGISARVGGGFLVDARDRELFTRNGWAVETSVESAGPPLGDFRFHRLSLIHRQYGSSGAYTAGLRFTVDMLYGDVPFWELPGVGGVDPIRDISGPTGLRGYVPGRFHEKIKAVLSFDNRIHRAPRRFLGIYYEAVIVPLGIDLGQLGKQPAWSLSSGLNVLFNKNFLVRSLIGYSKMGYEARLAFGQEF